MKTRRLEDLIGDKAFKLDTAHNIFLFLVALGDARNETTLGQARQWLEFNIKDMPHIFTLVPLFADFLIENFPLAQATTNQRDEMRDLVERAMFGGTKWYPEFMRFSQLSAVLIFYRHQIRRASPSVEDGRVIGA